MVLCDNSGQPRHVITREVHTCQGASFLVLCTRNNPPMDVILNYVRIDIYYP